MGRPTAAGRTRSFHKNVHASSLKELEGPPQLVIADFKRVYKTIWWVYAPKVALLVLVWRTKLDQISALFGTRFGVRTRSNAFGKIQPSVNVELNFRFRFRFRKFPNLEPELGVQFSSGSNPELSHHYSGKHYEAARKAHIEAKECRYELSNKAEILLNECEKHRANVKRERLLMELAYEARKREAQRGLNPKFSTRSRMASSQLRRLGARISAMMRDEQLMTATVRARVKIPAFHVKTNLWGLFVEYGEAISRIWRVQTLVRERAKTTRALLHEAQAVLNSDATIRETFGTREQLRLEYSRALKEAEDTGAPRPENLNVDQRSLEELEVEVQSQESKLSMLDLFGFDG
ncbi:hypothetical protein B0H13DRAFT_1876000 [Mycena leptocephala]|nr:hypothetical protein B0H13DRAFT_1876000 [Mycena leptocephala]